MANKGHGTVIARAPAATPQTFTDIAELGRDIQYPTLTRPETNVTTHNDNIDTWVLGVMEREPFTFGMNFVYDNATHDHLTGLLKAMQDDTKDGYRLTGPDGSVWVVTGNIRSISRVAPVREGVIGADVTVRLSGPMYVEGVLFGT